MAEDEPDNERVLIVGLGESAHAQLGRVLAAGGYRCTFAADAAHARELLAGQQFDLLLCDVRLASRALAAGVPAASLTRREHEVLQLAADGLSAQAIASALVVSPGTIKTHFQNIYAKLDASNRAAAVAIGLREGIIV